MLVSVVVWLAIGCTSNTEYTRESIGHPSHEKSLISGTRYERMQHALRYQMT